MAMSVMYTTINGVLYHENRGGVETEYIPDTLGSLIGCRDSSGNVTYTADYWPYGEVRTSTGSKTSPWGFVGLLGYLTDIAKRLYVRARHYRPSVGQWQTVDPVWPFEWAYRYAYSSPENYVDFTGRNPICIGCGICVGAAALGLLLSCVGSADVGNCIKCRISSNPWLQGVLLGCAAVCVACVGSFVIQIIRGLLVPPPIPVGAFALSKTSGDPCTSQPEDCWGRYFECQEANPRPGCPWWASPCSECFARCKIDERWPSDPNCSFWSW